MNYEPSESEKERMIDEQGAEYLNGTEADRQLIETVKRDVLDAIAGWAKQAARDVTARHTPGRYKATDRKMVQLDELLGQLEWMKSK